MPEPDPVMRSGAAAIPGDDLPATLRWAVWLLLAEAAGLAAVVAYLVYADATAPATSAGSALMVTVFAAFIAVVLLLLGRGLGRRRSWARGPAMVLQLLLLPLGYTMITTGLAWLGAPVMLIGLGGAAALIAPATREALGRPGPR